MPTHANINIIQQWATKHIGLKSAATVKRKATRDIPLPTNTTIIGLLRPMA